MIFFADFLRKTCEDAPMLKIGDRAPEFCLSSDAGKDTSLKDFKGKRVLIFFFPKANTSG